MTLAHSILDTYRKNRLAMQGELVGTPASSLRTNLEQFESYWRGAQHLLKKPQAEMSPEDQCRTSKAEFGILLDMAFARGSISPGSCTDLLYQLPSFENESRYLGFVDCFITDQLMKWGRRSLIGGNPDQGKFDWSWIRSGITRSLSLKLKRGGMERSHVLSFTPPKQLERIGDTLAALRQSWYAFKREIEGILAPQSNWPSDGEIEERERMQARYAAKTLVERTSPEIRALLKKYPHFLMEALQASRR